MLPFFWVGAAAVYFWGLRVGGAGPAVLATLLFTTTPTVLAHAGLVTTDMALTAFVSATLVASLYWVEKPGWRRSSLLGVLLGLALLSKFSALAFLPAAWLLMYALHLFMPAPAFRQSPARRQSPVLEQGPVLEQSPGRYGLQPVRPSAARRGPGERTRAVFRSFFSELRKAWSLTPWALLTALIAVALVWAGYRFAVGPVDYLHATLPAPAFFTGIHYVYLHNQGGHLAYLLGQLSQTGFWYYYPVVLAVKTPLPTLVLMLAALWFTIRRRDRLPLALPMALVAAMLGVGLFSHINIGVRHILPIYTGFAVCGGAALNRLFRSRHKWLAAAAAALLLLQIATGVLVHPDYIAYTNELAGSHPERILADSDLDWDQGMRGLALRLEELGIQDLTFKLNSSSYMIANGHSFPRYEYMPDGDQPPPGWSAVCVTAWKLSGQPKWAERIEPNERIRRSIYLYYFAPVGSSATALPLNRFPNHLRQFFLTGGGADEQLLPGTIREPDRFPAVLRGNRDADLHRTPGIPHGTDHAGDHGAYLAAPHQPVQHRPETLENAVLDLELALRRPEPEGHGRIVTWRARYPGRSLR